MEKFNSIRRAHCFLYHEVCDSPKESGFQRKGALPYTYTIEHFRSNLNSISERTLYDLPGIYELIRYWFIQKEFR